MSTDSQIYFIIGSLFVIGIITTYFNVRKNQKFKMNDAEIYKVDKKKGYDYNNPKRFFSEPLMRYIFTPMAVCIGSLVILGVISLIFFGNDGGRGLMKLIGVDLANYILGGMAIIGIGCLIPYTFLYYIRGWNDHEKWRMQY